MGGTHNNPQWCAGAYPFAYKGLQPMEDDTAAHKQEQLQREANTPHPRQSDMQGMGEGPRVREQALQHRAEANAGEGGKPARAIISPASRSYYMQRRATLLKELDYINGIIAPDPFKLLDQHLSKKERLTLRRLCEVYPETANRDDLVEVMYPNGHKHVDKPHENARQVIHRLRRKARGTGWDITTKRNGIQVSDFRLVHEGDGT